MNVKNGTKQQNFSKKLLDSFTHKHYETLLNKNDLRGKAN